MILEEVSFNRLAACSPAELPPRAVVAPLPKTEGRLAFCRVLRKQIKAAIAANGLKDADVQSVPDTDYYVSVTLCEDPGWSATFYVSCLAAEGGPEPLARAVDELVLLWRRAVEGNRVYSLLGEESR